MLKKRTGQSKFRPRTPSAPKEEPKPEPKQEPKPAPTKPQNKEALSSLQELKEQINEGTSTHKLYKILENKRDELTEIIGFSPIIRDMGVVINKLKQASDIPLNSESIEAFRKKVGQWQSKV